MAQTSPRDPRFRPFRAAAYAVYLVLVVGFCSLLIYSVITSVRRKSPAALPASEQVLSVRECVEKAQALFTQLESEREGFVRRGPAQETEARWGGFRDAWMAEFRTLESRCAPQGTRSRPGLRPIFEQLERLQDRYATHATQFAATLGDEIDVLRALLAEARKDPSFGRLP